MSYQQTTIVGNPSADPEMAYSANGKPYTRMSIAVNKTWTGNDGVKHEETTWYRATCFEKKAEIAANFIKKGKEVMLIGEVKASPYTDRDGKPAASLELIVQQIILLSNGGGNRSDTSGSGGQAHTEMKEEDLPF